MNGITTFKVVEGIGSENQVLRGISDLSISSRRVLMYSELLNLKFWLQKMVAEMGIFEKWGPWLLVPLASPYRRRCLQCWYK